MSKNGQTCLQLLASSSRSEKIEGVTRLKKVFIEGLEEADVIVSGFLQNYSKSSGKSNIEIEVELLIATCILLHAKKKLYLRVEQLLWMELRSVALRELSAGTDLNLRQTAGSFLASLCQKRGPEMFSEIKDEVIAQIKESNQKCLKKPQSDAREQKNENQVSTAGASSPVQTTSPQDIFAATSAWKLLDTWLYCLNKVASSCGSNFCRFIDAPLIACLEEAMRNEERFVRESCCALLQCFIVECALYQTFNKQKGSAKSLDGIVKVICLGMRDAWPDVRLPACVAARQILLASKFGKKAIDNKLLVIFLPYLCFNRYSKADGLQQYSQETWEKVTRGEGKQLIEKHIEAVFQLYREMLISSSPESQEVACDCLSECVKKLDKKLMAPLIGQIYEALDFHTEGGSSGSGGIFRGSVVSLKEAGCMLVENLVLHYPQQSFPYATSIAKVLLDLVEDSALTVKEASSSALVSLYKVARDGRLLDELVGKIRSGLARVRKMTKGSNSEKTISNDDNYDTSKDDLNDKNKDINDNNNDEVTGDDNEDSKIICRSNEVRLNAFKIEAAHSTITFPRPPPLRTEEFEMWNGAEGCVTLMRKLSAIKSPEVQDKIASLIPILVESVNERELVGRVGYVECVLRELPTICANLEKKVVKGCLESFFGVIIEFYPPGSSNESGSQASKEAVDCLRRMSGMVGAEVAMARLKMHDGVFFEQFFESSLKGV